MRLNLHNLSIPVNAIRIRLHIKHKQRRTSLSTSSVEAAVCANATTVKPTRQPHTYRGEPHTHTHYRERAKVVRVPVTVAGAHTHTSPTARTTPATWSGPPRYKDIYASNGSNGVFVGDKFELPSPPGSATASAVASCVDLVIRDPELERDVARLLKKNKSRVELAEVSRRLEKAEVVRPCVLPAPKPKSTTSAKLITGQAKKTTRVRSSTYLEVPTPLSRASSSPSSSVVSFNSRTSTSGLSTPLTPLTPEVRPYDFPISVTAEKAAPIVGTSLEEDITHFKLGA